VLLDLLTLLLYEDLGFPEKHHMDFVRSLVMGEEGGREGGGVREEVESDLLICILWATLPLGLPMWLYTSCSVKNSCVCNKTISFEDQCVDYESLTRSSLRVPVNHPITCRENLEIGLRSMIAI
jgi:hypothetical protein